VAGAKVEGETERAVACSFDVRPADVAFDAGNDLAELPIEAGRPAAVEAVDGVTAPLRSNGRKGLSREAPPPRRS
jgi:hypothetical protein